MDNVRIDYETDFRTGFVRAQITGWVYNPSGWVSNLYMDTDVCMGIPRTHVHASVGPWMSTRVRAAAAALAVWAGHVLRAEPRDERIRES